MFVPGKSPVKVQPKIPYIFLGELNVVCIERETTFSLCGKCDVDRLGSISFLYILSQFWFSARLGWFAVSVKQWKRLPG
jgi:hypothetical protein